MHTEGVINQVKSIKKMHSDLEVIAGNIATGEAAKALVKLEQMQLKSE